MKTPTPPQAGGSAAVHMCCNSGTAGRTVHVRARALCLLILAVRASFRANACTQACAHMR
eukprot:15442813-Alexandrium_andersonii.AAC.1